MRTVIGAIGCLLVLTACGGGDDNSASPAAHKPSKPATAVEYGSLTELKDAAVAGGYVCEKWVADNQVTLAAESGTCDDESVFSTYASDADLQAQLDTDKSMDEMMLENGIDTTPQLIGPNWIITAPQAAEIRKDLAGVLIGAKTAK